MEIRNGERGMENAERTTKNGERETRRRLSNGKREKANEKYDTQMRSSLRQDGTSSRDNFLSQRTIAVLP